MRAAPSGTRPPATPVHPPLDPAIVLAGVVRAGARAWWAPVIDLALVVVVLVAGWLLAPAIGILAALMLLAVTFVGVARYGQTVGHRLLRVRTVALSTGLPATASTWRTAGVLTADLTGGRDPLSARPSGTARRPAEGVDPWTPARAAAGDHALLVLSVDDGTVLPVTGRAILGRRPTDPSGTHQLIALTDLSRTVSRNHVLLDPAGERVWVADLGSANGTRLAPPGQGYAVVPAGIRTVAGWGWRLALGDRELTLTDPRTVELP